MLNGKKLSVVAGTEKVVREVVLGKRLVNVATPALVTEDGGAGAPATATLAKRFVAALKLKRLGPAPSDLATEVVVIPTVLAAENSSLEFPKGNRKGLVEDGGTRDVVLAGLTPTDADSSCCVLPGAPKDRGGTTKLNLDVTFDAVQVDTTEIAGDENGTTPVKLYGAVVLDVTLLVREVPTGTEVWDANIAPL